MGYSTLDPTHVVTRTDRGDDSLMWRCAGCDQVHRVVVSADCWRWNGSLSAPTIEPSILLRWHYGEAQTLRVCHSFVRSGVVEFLGDCTHGLAGMSIPMEPRNADPFAERAPL
ncbi:MAG: hypothetical protein K2Q20_06640 [Phycisphaerales bacterium]|nr:hypothetical protein [Phycisphaerales bacterium]